MAREIIKEGREGDECNKEGKSIEIPPAATAEEDEEDLVLLRNDFHHVTF